MLIYAVEIFGLPEPIVRLMSREDESKASEGLKREIGLLDIVFVSFGGQSPFLSVLSYGVYAFVLAEGFAPIAIALGTLIVLINGLVIYELSSRFTKAGGYMTYAYYTLSETLGFQTGWLYVFYAVLYGSAYVVAVSLVLGPLFNIDPLVFTTLVLAVASTLLMLGVRPTTKYAMVASTLEAGIMAFLAIGLIYKTGWHFYNPFTVSVPAGTLSQAIIFGAGIPTGYGSIAPVSGEVKNAKRNVPLAIIIVILLGGGLAAFDTYAIADYLYYKHLTNLGNIGVIDIVSHEFGIITKAIAVFAALNDGVLATMAFMLAASRTIYALAYYGFFPEKFKVVKPGKGPIYGIALALAGSALVVYSLTVEMGASQAFATLGYLSLLAGLLVHVVANLSLLRISAKKWRKRLTQIGLAVAGTVMTLIIAVDSIGSTPSSYVIAFLLWMLAGYFYIEAKGISEELKEEREGL